jgi:UDP-N-acetylmuramoyl-tripeptide--D-alanyl-D-alanine ligase
LSWTTREIAEQSGGQLLGDPEVRVAGFSTDTRTLERGELFVAIPGPNFDGHDFVAEAIGNGAAAALVSGELDASVRVPVIRVGDTIEALGRLAAGHRERFSGPVVAITGSNGKTTTREMCAAILAAAGVRVRRSAGNLNNHIGLPLSVLTLTSSDRALVVELGMSHEGEIDRLAQIAQPTVGAVTNVAPAHLGPLGSLEAIARAKGELFERIRPDGAAVVNADDEHCLAQAARFAGRHLSFGRSANADFRIREQRASTRGECFLLETPSGPCRVSLSIPGAHLVEDAACAAAAAYATDLLGPDPLEAIGRGLARFSGLPGRLALLSAPGGIRVLDDSYNANPRSLEVALATLARVAGDGRVLAVLGDMLELGEDETELHAEAGRAAAEAGVDVLVAVGGRSHHTASAAARAGVSETHELADSTAAARRISQLVLRGDTVLVKGSRGMSMERVVAALLESA